MNAFEPPAIAVVVMHPEPLIAAGLVTALEGHPGIEVTRDSAAKGHDLVYAADILVTDYRNALALRAATTEADGGWVFKRAKLLIVTDLDGEHDIRLAFEQEVEGYLLQGCALEELVRCVRKVAAGGRYMTEALAQCMAESLTRQPLTTRETDVLRLLAVGQCNKTIARELEISSSTVKSHVQAILRKLSAASRTEAISLADRRGLLGSRMTRRHAQDGGRREGGGASWVRSIDEARRLA